MAIETGRRVTQAFREDRAELRAIPRIAGSLLMIQEVLQAKPVTTRARDRVYVYRRYLEALAAEAEAPDSTAEK